MLKCLGHEATSTVNQHFCAITVSKGATFDYHIIKENLISLTLEARISSVHHKILRPHSTLHVAQMFMLRTAITILETVHSSVGHSELIEAHSDT